MVSLKAILTVSAVLYEVSSLQMHRQYPQFQIAIQDCVAQLNDYLLNDNGQLSESEGISGINQSCKNLQINTSNELDVKVRGQCQDSSGYWRPTTITTDRPGACFSTYTPQSYYTQGGLTDKVNNCFIRLRESVFNVNGQLTQKQPKNANGQRVDIQLCEKPLMSTNNQDTLILRAMCPDDNRIYRRAQIDVRLTRFNRVECRLDF